MHQTATDTMPREGLLSFDVGPYRLCAPVSQVETIMMVPAYRSLPGAPSSVVGVFSHRRRIVHIICLRRKLGAGMRNGIRGGQLVLSQISSGLTGFWVDAVCDIIPSAKQCAQPLDYLRAHTDFSRIILADGQIYIHTDFELLYQAPDMPAVVRHDENAGMSPLSPPLAHDRSSDGRCGARGGAKAVSADLPGQKRRKRQGDLRPDNGAESATAAMSRTAAGATAARPQAAWSREPDKGSNPMTSVGHRSTGTVDPNRLPAKRPPTPYIQAPRPQGSISRQPERQTVKFQADRASDAAGTEPKPGAGKLYWVFAGVILLAAFWGMVTWLRPVSSVPRATDRQAPAAVALSGDKAGRMAKPAASRQRPEAALPALPQTRRMPPPPAADSTGERPSAPKTENRPSDDFKAASQTASTRPTEDAVPPSKTGRQRTPLVLLTESEAELLRIDTDDFTLTVQRPLGDVGRGPDSRQAAVAAVEPPADNDEGAVAGVYTHIVIRGDTLWDIAAQHLGDPFRYPELAELSRIREPDWIYPGDIIRIIKKKTD